MSAAAWHNRSPVACPNATTYWVSIRRLAVRSTASRPIASTSSAADVALIALGTPAGWYRVSPSRSDGIALGSQYSHGLESSSPATAFARATPDARGASSCASDSTRVTARCSSAPPPPALNPLPRPKLRIDQSAIAPPRTPPLVPPACCAASSITSASYGLANSMTAPMSTIHPNRCTATTCEHPASRHRRSDDRSGESVSGFVSYSMMR